LAGSVLVELPWLSVFANFAVADGKLFAKPQVFRIHHGLVIQSAKYKLTFLITVVYPYLRRVKVCECAPESEQGTVCLAFVNLRAEHGNHVLRKFGLNALQRAWADGSARSGEEDGKGNLSLKSLRLPFHQLDGFHRLGCIEVGALGGMITRSARLMA